jgi:hypothetical protein
MCLEIHLRYRCACTIYSTISHCPHISAANELITFHSLSENDPKFDGLYEKCEAVAAKRFLAMFEKCGTCEREVADIEGGGGKERKDEAGNEDADRGGGEGMAVLERVVKRRR